MFEKMTKGPPNSLRQLFHVYIYIYYIYIHRYPTYRAPFQVDIEGWQVFFFFFFSQKALGPPPQSMSICPSLGCLGALRHLSHLHQQCGEATSWWPQNGQREILVLGAFAVVNHRNKLALKAYIQKSDPFWKRGGLCSMCLEV